jgi:hypothetical protein
MNNIELVTGRLKSIGKPTLNLIHTKLNNSFLVLDSEIWRMYDFKEGTISYDIAPDLNVIFEASRAFAEFSDSLTSLQGSLKITIPEFHSLKFRMNQLRMAIQRSDAENLPNELISQIFLLAEKLLILEESSVRGHIPTYTVHNDTKINNILFHRQSGEAYVIDLDTVMPGIIHFDIGDLIRTTCTTLGEDEEDLNRVFPDKRKIEMVYEGYLCGLQKKPNQTEMELLQISGPYMALIMGVRFLTDHLSGNKYYKTEKTDHNLIRARNQIHLSQQLMPV